MKGGSVRRVAVITGASQGLGLALAGGLAERGWALVVDARRDERLTAAVEALSAAASCGRHGCFPSGTDHRRRRRHRRPGASRRRCSRRPPRSDRSTSWSTTPARSAHRRCPRSTTIDSTCFARTFDVNVIAPIALVARVAATWRRAPTVVDITSDAAVEAYPGWGGYGASRRRSSTPAACSPPSIPSCAVLVVDPGDMRTEMHQDAFPGEDISDRPAPDDSVPGLLGAHRRRPAERPLPRT